MVGSCTDTSTTALSGKKFAFSVEWKMLLWGTTAIFFPKNILGSLGQWLHGIFQGKFEAYN